MTGERNFKFLLEIDWLIGV